MTDVQFPKPTRPSSSYCWSLGSNKHASGSFPKVSISIAIPVEKPQTGTHSKATQGLRLSQEKLLEEVPKGLSQEIASKKSKPWVTSRSQNSNKNPIPVPNSNPIPNSSPNLNPNGNESVLGKRKEPVQEGAHACTSGTKNNEGLRMKLWEILAAGSQNKEAAESPQDREENVKISSQKQNRNEKESGENIKSNQNQSNKGKGKLVRESNPFSDPIETDSESPKRVDSRPVTRASTRNSRRGKSESFKKPLSPNNSDQAPMGARISKNILTGGSSCTSRGANEEIKRAKIEPRRINFTKSPLITEKTSKEPSHNEMLKSPLKETTPSHNNVPKAGMIRRNQGNSSSNRASKNKENENSWEFPVTPVITGNKGQEKEVLSPIFERNRRVLAYLNDPSVNKTNLGVPLRRRKPVEKEALGNTSVFSGLKGSSAIKTNPRASMQRRKMVKKPTSPVRSDDMHLDPSTDLPPLAKPNTGSSSKKPVKILESPVTSNNMQVEKEAERNNDSRGSFANTINSGAFMQKRKPVEFQASPVTSDDMQSDKEAERNKVDSKGSSADKINSESLMQKRKPVELQVSPVTSEDMQLDLETERNNNSKDSFANNQNSGAFMQKGKQAALQASPVTSEEMQLDKEPERNNNISKGSFANKINSGSSLQKEKFVQFPVSPVMSNEMGTESPLFGAKSPTFAMNGTSSSKKEEEVSRNPKISESSVSGSDSDLELSEDTRDSNNDDKVPIEDVETQSIGISGFLNKGYRRTDTLFANPDSPTEPAPIIKNKLGGKLVKEPERKDPLDSPVGTEEEANAWEDIPNEFPDNSLASAMCQLATVLKRFKSKLKNKTDAKSAEILSLTAEKVQEKLKDTQVHIQEDMQKLLGSSKSKRKQLESKFQEQAEKLNRIHEKFREEVNQHLVECKSSFEEYEAYQSELKEISDKQKTLHRKLLRHVEEETKAEICEAENKISRVHREAQKKMNGLKSVLKEWIPEGAD